MQGEHGLHEGGYAGGRAAQQSPALQSRDSLLTDGNPQWRGLATRYDKTAKTATIYLAGLHIVGIFIWSAR